MESIFCSPNVITSQKGFRWHLEELDSNLCHFQWNHLFCCLEAMASVFMKTCWSQQLLQMMSQWFLLLHSSESGDLALNWFTSGVFVCSADNGSPERTIRLTSPHPGFTLKGVNYNTVKTQLLFSFHRGPAPSLRLIQLWFHHSNKAASTGSIHPSSLTN